MIHITRDNISKRAGGGSPIGSVTPLYRGEQFRDTTLTPNGLYVSTGLTNTDWVNVSDASDHDTYQEQLKGSLNLNSMHIKLNSNLEGKFSLPDPGGPTGGYNTRTVLSFALNKNYTRGIVASAYATEVQSMQDNTAKILLTNRVKSKTYYVSNSHLDCRRYYSEVHATDGEVSLDEYNPGAGELYDKSYSELSSQVDKGKFEGIISYYGTPIPYYSSAFIPNSATGANYVVESMWIEYDAGPGTSVLKIALLQKTPYGTNLGAYNGFADCHIFFHGDPKTILA